MPASAVFTPRRVSMDTPPAYQIQENIDPRIEVLVNELIGRVADKCMEFAHTVFPVLGQAIASLTIETVAHVLDRHGGDFEANLRALVAERIALAVHH